jgi:protein-tyrosine phosphatase
MKPTIYRIAGPWTGTLAIIARPRGYDWLEDEMKGLAESGIGVVVYLLTAQENRDLGLTEEARIAGQHGLRFINFPVNDYSVPASPEALFGLVTTLDDLLARGYAVGIHCRQGIGRSSLLAACLLSLSTKNIDDCFNQISNARGTSVPDTTEQLNWVCTFARDFASQSVAE